MSTVCPRSSYPFYIVSYYINWVTTSWIYINKPRNLCDRISLYSIFLYLVIRCRIIRYPANPCKTRSLRRSFRLLGTGSRKFSSTCLSMKFDVREKAILSSDAYEEKKFINVKLARL